MSGGFFRGTSAEQDTRFSNKQAKLLKTQKFAPELEHLVDMTKVKMDVIRPWIATRVTQLLGFEDEVLINFIYGLLDGKEINGKEVQISLTGFMEKNTGKFMKELWSLLLSAQKNASGVPQQFLDAKEEETRKKREEADRIANEIRKKKEKENGESEQEGSKKMDGGPEPRATVSELKSSNARRGGMKEGDEKNGPKDGRRLRRSSHSPNGSASSLRASQSQSISKSNSGSYSDDRRKRRSLSRSRGRSRSSDRSYRSRRRSVTPRRMHPADNSISPVRRRSAYSRRRSRSRSLCRSPSPRQRRLRSPYYKRSRSPVRRRRSPSPVQRRRSPSPVRRRRSPSPVRRRRSPMPIRHRSPSPIRHRRSPSPIWHRRSPSLIRRRSPSPIRRRSPSPIRHGSPSPIRRRSPSPIRRRSPSPIRRRSPSPVQRRRSPSPVWHPRSPSPHRRSPPPVQHHRSLSPVKCHGFSSPVSCGGSPSPVRRRGYASPRLRGPPSPVRRSSLGSPIKHHRSHSPDSHCGSPLSARRQGSSSPVQHPGSLSPLGQRRIPSPSSQRRSVSPVKSFQSPIRTSGLLSPRRRHQSPSPVRQRKTPLSRKHARSSPSRSRTPLPLKDRLLSASPSRLPKGQVPCGHRSPIHHRLGSPVETQNDLSLSVQRTQSLKGSKSCMARHGRSSPKGSISPCESGSLSPVMHNSPSHLRSSKDRKASPREPSEEKKRLQERSTPVAQICPSSSQSPSRAEKGHLQHQVSDPSPSQEKSASGLKSPCDKNGSVAKDIREKSSKRVCDEGPDQQIPSTTRKDSAKVKILESHGKFLRDSDQHCQPDAVTNVVGKMNRSNQIASASEESSDHGSKSKRKRKHKRSERKEIASDENNSYDSEVEYRKEAKKRRKQEKKLRKEERRQRREERRRKRKERRAEKMRLKDRSHSDGSDEEHLPVAELHPSDKEDMESDPKKLEIELRNKALESLKARKGISR